MSLQDTALNQEINSVDLSKIAGLQQKRTLAFVNHFLVTTVQFLNKFTKECEEKLMQFERKLEKVNASMVLLESKLSSIPEVNIPQTESQKEISPLDTQESKPENKEVINESSPAKEEPTDKDSKQTTDVTKTPVPEEKEAISPEYKKFVMMVQVGVPLQAVKLKMMLEGVDTTILDKILNR